MVTLTLCIFALLALSFDYIIFRRHIPRIKWLRLIYALQAIVIDIGVLVYLIYSFFNTEVYSDQTVVAATWLILIFMMSFTAKGVFGSFSFVEAALGWRSRKRRKWLVAIGGILAFVAFGVMLYGATFGRTVLRVETVIIESEDLPESFDGFRIAQFSDAHLGNLGVGNPIIKRMVARINDLKPDIVVQSGDLVNVHSGELNDLFMTQLSFLEAPVYSVFGNHDLGYYIRGNTIPPSESIEDLMAKQKALGWTLLRNENRVIRRGVDSIVIAGVVYPKDNRLGVRNNGYGGSDIRKAFKGVDDKSFSVLISHTPSLFDSIPSAARPNLTISGHVHAMQAKISIGDWQWSPAKWLYPMWSGLYEDRGHYLYINDGLGYALYPMRIGTRPEITLYELKTRKK